MVEAKTINLDTITRILSAHKEELQREYGIREIGIFGSWIRGEQKKGSDLDMLVEFDANSRFGLLRFVHLENYLSDLVGVKVDLVEKPALKPRIGKRILAEVVYL